MSAIWPTNINPPAKIDTCYGDPGYHRKAETAGTRHICKFCKKPTYRYVAHIYVCSDCERTHKAELPDPWNPAYVNR